MLLIDTCLRYTCLQDFFLCLSALAVAEEFTYEVIYGGDNSRKDLESAIALQLVRKQRDRASGLVVLIFNIVYAPYKPMR